MKALNLLANSPSAIHTKTQCQTPLLSALSSNWTLPGFPSANSIGVKQHLHFCTAASTWHFGIQETLTDEQENEKKKKAVLEITSNVLYVQFWLLVGLKDSFLRVKPCLPATCFCTRWVNKPQNQIFFFSPSLIKTVVLLAAHCRSAGQKMLGYQ